jgi:hypothetical protein
MLGNWPAVLLALSGSVDPQKAREELAHLASPELATDWGDRWLSDKSPLYDPVSYNNGTVWPFMQTFVALAQYNYGDPLNGFVTLRNTANLTGMQSPGALPEHMNGDRYLPGERSVPHQLFSSVAVIVGAVEGLLHAHGNVIKARLGTFAVDAAPGISIIPPSATPTAGEHSSGLKILRSDADAKARRWTLSVAGIVGRAYTLDLVSTNPVTANGATVEKTAQGYRLHISFEGEGYVEKKIEVRW